LKSCGQLNLAQAKAGNSWNDHTTGACCLLFYGRLATLVNVSKYGTWVNIVKIVYNKFCWKHLWA